MRLKPILQCPMCHSKEMGETVFKYWKPDKYEHAIEVSGTDYYRELRRCASCRSLVQDGGCGRIEDIYTSTYRSNIFRGARGVFVLVIVGSSFGAHLHNRQCLIGQDTYSNLTANDSFLAQYTIVMFASRGQGGVPLTGVIHQLQPNAGSLPGRLQHPWR